MGEIRSTIHNREDGEQTGGGELRGGLLQQRALADELKQIAVDQQEQSTQAKFASGDQVETVLEPEQKVDSTPQAETVPTANPQSENLGLDSASSVVDGEMGQQLVQEAQDQAEDAEDQAEQELPYGEVERHLADCRDGVDKIFQRDKLVAEAIGGAIDKLRRIAGRVPERDYRAQEDVSALLRALSAAQEAVEERSKILQRQMKDKIAQEATAKKLQDAEGSEGDMRSKQLEEVNTLLADFKKAVSQAEEDGDNITRFTNRKIRGVMDSLRSTDPLIAIINREIGDLESLVRAVSRGATQEAIEDIKLSAQQAQSAIHELQKQ